MEISVEKILTIENEKLLSVIFINIEERQHNLGNLEL